MSAHPFSVWPPHWPQADSQVEVSLTRTAMRGEELPWLDPALFWCDPVTVVMGCVWVKLRTGAASRQFPALAMWPAPSK